MDEFAYVCVLGMRPRKLVYSSADRFEPPRLWQQHSRLEEDSKGKNVKHLSNGQL